MMDRVELCQHKSMLIHACVLTVCHAPENADPVKFVLTTTAVLRDLDFAKHQSMLVDA